MKTHLPIIARIIILGCLLSSFIGCPAETKTDSKVETKSMPADGAVGSESSPAATSVAAVETSFEFTAPALTDTELKQGWISLFDGHTLFGWDIPETANWRVEDGAIVVDDGGVCLLSTPFRFGDFEFRCDFHVAKGGNSGIFLRTADGSTNPAKDTYELNICDDHPSHGTGSLVGRHVAENVPAVEGEWHTFHVFCNGNQIRVLLDSEEIVDFTDDTENVRLAGTIGLQMNKGRSAFRNVFLKPLNTEELFNGKDLTGWRDVPGSQCRFSVKDGSIHAESGPGFLETEDTFDDFVLHVEANINDAAAIRASRPANSGVFFRALAGTEKAPSYGYEMQIQHDFKDGDRSKPLDFGSGAIYRREPARYIVADNNAWFTETLIAQGNRFATFVNGYQVLAWVDDRKPDENPRKGQRLEAGHLSLQGHDPTTDLDFKALRIHLLAKP